MGTEPWYAALPEPGPGPSARWESPAFEAELRSWVAEALSVAGTELAGTELAGTRLTGTGLVGIEPVHQRPWSTVWRARTADGRVFWVKQNCRHQNFEARLLVTLGRLAGDRVVPVVAADLERGLHLVADQGPVLAETVAGDDMDAWCRVLVEAMHLQRELVGHDLELEAAGLTRMHTTDAAAYVAARTDSLASLSPDDPRRLPAEDADGIRALDPAIRRWAVELEALGLPDCLVHNDLHGHNVFASNGHLRFFDFGDAVLANPLCALLIPLRVMASRLDPGPDDARLRRVADAALEVWSDVAPMHELRAALPAALQLARLGRVESWLRVTATLTRAELADLGDAAAWWLVSLREDPPLR